MKILQIFGSYPTKEGVVVILILCINKYLII